MPKQYKSLEFLQFSGSFQITHLRPTLLYLKLNQYVLKNLGVAETSNPDYTGQSETKHNPYIYSVQNT